MLRLLLVALLLVIGGSAGAAPKEYTVQTLDTGLPVIGVESHKVPLVTIVLAAKAGAMTESAETNGLTHLWEHMFFKGNARLPDQEAFNKRIRQLGITYNGDTSAEKVRYFITLPSAFLDEGLQFMADAIATPLLEQKEMERERRVVLNEYERNAAQPTFDYANLQRNIIYGKLGFMRDPLGLRPIIANATRDQLLEIKRQVFVPANCALLVSGDFKPDELMKLAQKHFSDWKTPAGWLPIKPPEFQKFPDAMNFVMTRPIVQNARVQSTYEGPKVRTQPKDTYALDVLANLLEHRSGKFYHKFVDSGLTYSAGLSYYTQSQAGEIDLYAWTTAQKITKVHGLLLSEVREWVKPGYFTETQLSDVKRKISIARKRDHNAPSEFVKDLAFWWAVTDLPYFDTYFDQIQRVTIADVQSVVRRWLIGKPHVDGTLLSPEDAKAVGLKDDSGPLVDKYLDMYKPSGDDGAASASAASSDNQG